MEWGRLKNIIILILLLVNGFLLVLVGARLGEARQYERAALTQAIQVLENQGIEVDAGSLSPAKELPPLTIERDVEKEAQLVHALLGETTADNRGGGLYLYQNGMGEVSIRAGGELSAALGDSASGHTNHPESHAAALLKKMGVDARQIGADTQGDRTAVRFQQLWNGMPVFSGEVEFVYEDGALNTIHGVLLTAGQGAAEPVEVLDLPTALLRFLDGVTDTGDVCSAIYSMEMGYRGTAQSLSGGTRLTPVWLVSTNTASYYLDGTTGALIRVVE